jgi:hypothetical protein
MIQVGATGGGGGGGGEEEKEELITGHLIWTY